MRTISFKKISIQNFLSIGNECVSVDFSTGVHIITGINKDKEDRRNGVGKSAIADAIHFAVFGKTIREIKKENIINKVNRKNCKVELEFDITNHNNTDHYKVVRSLQPSKCWLYVNGEDQTRDSISNTNAFLQKRLKTTSDIFENCVIMTINSTTPFLAKNKGEKRKFIENIFNLKVFSEMADILKKDLTEIKRKSEVEFTKVEEVERNLKTQQRQKADYVEEKAEHARKIGKRKAENEKEIENLKLKIDQVIIEDSNTMSSRIEDIESAIEKCQDNLTKLAASTSEYQSDKRHKSNTLNKITANGDTCEHCLRPMAESDHNHIESEKERIVNEIEKINQDIDTVATSIKDYDTLKVKLKTGITSLNDKIQANAVKMTEKGNWEKRVVQLIGLNAEMELDESSSSLLKHYDEEIDTLTNRLSKAKKQVQDIRDSINLMDIVKFVLSEEGVKSYIVKKILQLFNSRLSYYLKRMDANCICIFNEYFEEEIFDEKGQECSYFNFSGAERKNLDLACLFTFMDIRRLQGDVTYNISVYDELLDSSLDEKGVNMVIDILRERVEKLDECVMIISHRKESVKAAGDKNTAGTNDIIFLQKENGITKRVEYSE